MKFHLQRASDWSAELQEAATLYEQAAGILARDPFAPGAADNMTRAKQRYRRAILDQDRQRRPETYTHNI